MAGYPPYDPFAPLHFPGDASGGGGGGDYNSSYGQPMPPPSGYYGQPPPGTYGAPPPTSYLGPPASTYGSAPPGSYGAPPPATMYGGAPMSGYAGGVGGGGVSFDPYGSSAGGWGQPPASGAIAFDPSSYRPTDEPIPFDPSSYAGPYPSSGGGWSQPPPSQAPTSYYGGASYQQQPQPPPTQMPQTFYGGPTAPQGGPPTYQQQAAPPPAYTQQPVAPTPQIYGAPAIQVITPQPQPQPQVQVPPPAYQQQMVQVQGNQPSQQQIAQQQLAAKQAEMEDQMQRWKLSQAAAEPAKVAVSPPPASQQVQPQEPAKVVSLSSSSVNVKPQGGRLQGGVTLGARPHKSAQAEDVKAEGEGRTQPAPALSRTQTMEMPMRRKKTEEPEYTFTFEFKDKPEFVGELVSTAKQLLLDTGKLVDTLSQEFMEVQGTSGGAIKQTLLFTVESVRKMVARLVAMIKYGVQHNIVQNPTQAKFLQGGATSMQSSANAMLNAATTTLANMGGTSEEKVKRTMQQYYTAVTLSVKNILQAAEFLNASTAVEEVEPEPAPEPQRPVSTQGAAADKGPVARGTLSPGFNLQDYDPKKVSEVQALYRKTHLKKRLRSLVIEYKDSKCSQEQKQRARVLREVVATEQTYVQSLYQCIKFFLVPLKEKAKDNRWIMTLEDVHRLFSTIEVIHQFNAEFSQQLDKRMAEWPNVNTFGDIFLQMVPMMKMYTTYINEYDGATAVWTKYSVKQEFADYIAQLRKNSGGRLDLVSMLIQPVQRLPRYEMLLKELLKHTPSTHVDYENLVEAIERIKELNEYVNERKRQTDNRNFIIKLQEQITEMPLVMVTPSRMFIKHGELTGASVKLPKKRKSMVFLFNDLVVRAKVVKPNEKYVFEEYAGLSGLGLGALQGLNFALKRPEGDWEFNCASEAEAKMWYGEFKNAIEARQLQDMCNDKLERSKAKEKSLHILSATYGDLNEPKYALEVTQQLQDMCEAQGGELIIPGGTPKSKLPGFVDPTAKSALPSFFSSFKYKKQLLVVWSDSKGAHTRTYGDTEPVFIQYS